jgi:hypothetical protein
MTTLDRIYDELPDLERNLTELATESRLLEWFRVIGDTPAPSQTAGALRGAAIRSALATNGTLARGRYDSDVAGSGCEYVQHGVDGARLVAHLDEISYVYAGPRSDEGWPLLAYCYHLADGPRRARVVRWAPDHGYNVVDEGQVVGTSERLHYRSDAGLDLQPGDRVALWSPVSADEGSTRVTGAIDNAAGVAACVVAAEVLDASDVPYSLLLPDEEEGPSGCSSTTISRGAARVYPHLEQAPLTLIVDTQGLSDHDLSITDGHRHPYGATLSEYSSQTRGGVTPPPLYAGLRELADALTNAGAPVRPATGYVPRSDDAVAQLYTRHIGLLGYPGINRHFDQGLPATNLLDLVSLARALAVTSAAAHLRLLPVGGSP